MKKTALLASDMDGTVIPLDSKWKREAEIAEFKRLIETNSHIALAYVTGRHLELGLEGVKHYRLPMPDIFVCDVGTTIYFNTENEWHLDQGYRATLKQAWQGRNGTDIAAILTDLVEIDQQEPERQKEFKQSYYVSRSVDEQQLVRRITNRLADQEIQANVIYSVDTQRQIGLIDVLPPIAAKDYALEYLQQKLKLEFDSVVYAGDSGNDLLAFVSGFNAIIVNNTTDVVKDEVQRLAEKKNIIHRTYFASEKYVQGVMEGCIHYQLFRE